MGKDARSDIRRTGWKLLGAATATAAVFLTAACSGGGSSSSGDSGGGDVTLEFSQWWAPEMPKGALSKLIDEFEKKNPKIHVKLNSAPFASVQDQTVADAASGTMADVVGLDGSWVNPLVKQGALLDLTAQMKKAGYDDSQLASQVKLKGKAYMIPVVNFAYPLFTNDAILEKAGIDKPPATWSEFKEDAAKISDLGGNTKGWVVPLGTKNPNGAKNDIMSWAWASGGSMLKDGQPHLTDNDKVTGAVKLVKDVIEAKDVIPGPESLQEVDKVNNFMNGRVGMMIDSMAHINTIREEAPDLKFSVSAQPVQDGYTGTPGINVASWGIGISAKSEHPDQAWKLVSFLLSKDVNSTMATEANGFPGNKNSAPDFSDADPHFKQAFDIYQKSTPVNEFSGLPSAQDLMRDFVTEFQKTLNGGESVEEMLKTVQGEWKDKF